jgi:hypothetical protein
VLSAESDIQINRRFLGNQILIDSRTTASEYSPTAPGSMIMFNFNEPTHTIRLDFPGLFSTLTQPTGYSFGGAVLFVQLSYFGEETTTELWSSDYPGFEWHSNNLVSFPLTASSLIEWKSFDITFNGDQFLMLPAFVYAQLELTWTPLTSIEDPYMPIIDVGSNYSLLPNTNGKFYEILSAELIDITSNTYLFHMQADMNYLGWRQIYKFQVAIPSDVDIESALESEYPNITFTTFEDGSRILYIQPDITKEAKPLDPSIGNTISEYMYGFATLNMTTSQYHVFKTFDFSSIVYKDSAQHAYVYMLFDQSFDQLISVTIDYKYRINSLFSKGDWVYESNAYVHGTSYEASLPNWVYWVPAFGWGFGLGTSIFGNDIYDIDEVIQKIDSIDLPDKVTTDYIDSLGGSLSELETTNIYKVHLGQFSAPFSVGYDISNFAVTRVLYMDNGVLIDVPYNFIDQETILPEVEVDWYEKIDRVIQSLSESSSVFLSKLLVIMKYSAIAVGSFMILTIIMKIINLIKPAKVPRKYKRRV